MLLQKDLLIIFHNSIHFVCRHGERNPSKGDFKLLEDLEKTVNKVMQHSSGVSA